MFIRTCKTRTGTRAELPATGDEQGRRAGPVHIAGFQNIPAIEKTAVTPDEDGTVYPLKYPTTVDTSSPVWMVVDVEDRDAFALNYNNGDWARRVKDGQHTVGFEACDAPRFRWYNGGFLASTAGCARLHIFVGDGPTGVPIETLQVPFAVDDCN